MSKCPLFHLHCNDLKQNVNVLAEALDATSFTLLHGDRPQQIKSGNAARSLLNVKGYSVRPSKLSCFTVKARFDDILGTYTWEEQGLNSTDVLLIALEQIETKEFFSGKSVTISIVKTEENHGN